MRKVRTSSRHLLAEIRTIHGTCQIFFRNKTFLSLKIESWNFQHLFDLGFRETLQNFSPFRQTFRWHFSMGNKSCPNELKFCEVSWNPKSIRCWKIHLSIMKSKEDLFLKDIWGMLVIETLKSKILIFWIVTRVSARDYTVFLLFYDYD